MREHPNIQNLSDMALEKQGNEKYSTLLFKLNPNERNALVICNLNYQVENGGFLQYFENGYHCGIPFVEHVMRELDTSESKEVIRILKEAVVLWLCIESRESHSQYIMDFQELTENYFKVNNALIDQVEAYLSKCVSDQ